jgi:hypothetical protein
MTAAPRCNVTGSWRCLFTLNNHPRIGWFPNLSLSTKTHECDLVTNDLHDFNEIAKLWIHRIHHNSSLIFDGGNRDKLQGVNIVDDAHAVSDTILATFVRKKLSQAQLVLFNMPIAVLDVIGQINLIRNLVADVEEWNGDCSRAGSTRIVQHHGSDDLRIKQVADLHC